MKLRSRHNKKKGFTLIELLVVIAIIAILSVVVILTLNPSELLRQSRDSNRLSDLSVLKTALSLYVTDQNTNLASSSLGYTACYVSTITNTGTTTPKCGVFSGAGITTIGSSSATTFRNIDSTGWVPVKFNAISEGSPFGSLPVDPTNNSNYYYTYAASSTGVFELATFIESSKYKSGGTSVVTTGTIYETGTNLFL